MRGSARQEPVEVGYSSHEGAENAGWGDEKLEIVGGTQPVVYPAAGSHANKFTEALYLGSSAEAGVGCDDTRGPQSRYARGDHDPERCRAAARRSLDHIRGALGELQQAFFNGPTGPNMKTQWMAPIEWSEDWRDRSYAVPTGGLLGTSATDSSAPASRGLGGADPAPAQPGCDASSSSRARRAVAFVVIRRPGRRLAPLRVARRRAWGQILSSPPRCT